MSKPIIFVDLDGPFYSYGVIGYHPDNRKPYPGELDVTDSELSYWRMDEMSRVMWNHLTDVYDFEVVISSSWRKYFNKPEFFHDLFGANDLTLPLHKTDPFTPIHKAMYAYTHDYDCPRYGEIKVWLDRHPEVTQWIAMDDYDSGYSLYSLEKIDKQIFDNNVVMVDMDCGWGKSSLDKLIRLVKRFK